MGLGEIVGFRTQKIDAQGVPQRRGTQSKMEKHGKGHGRLYNLLGAKLAALSIPGGHWRGDGRVNAPLFLTKRPWGKGRGSVRPG